jgi:hypothetical protein
LTVARLCVAAPPVRAKPPKSEPLPIPLAIENNRPSRIEKGKAFRGLAKREGDLRPLYEGF